MTANDARNCSDARARFYTRYCGWPVGRMTVLASVQTAQDGSMSFGLVLTAIAALFLLAFALVGLGWIFAALEDRTRYDEVEDTYPAERIPAGRSWK